jgi:hypothetical protein
LRRQKKEWESKYIHPKTIDRATDGVPRQPIVKKLLQSKLVRQNIQYLQWWIQNQQFRSFLDDILVNFDEEVMQTKRISIEGYQTRIWNLDNGKHRELITFIELGKSTKYHNQA